MSKPLESEHRLQREENLWDHSQGFPALNLFAGALSSNIHARLVPAYVTILLNKETALVFPRFDLLI